ncbi:hypothetical protein FRC07_009886 [Ceratobasidium sp. 392]|nr:hypothetical protein FRC07_009886 [Ceratobasidium sp. 392]
MFFARLAIAALSFGSAAKVLAAPIGVAVVPVAGTAVEVSAERRVDLTFSALLDTTTAALDNIKSKVDSIVNDPLGPVADKLGPVITKVAPLVDGLNQKLQAVDIDANSLLLDKDGVAKLTDDALGASLTDVFDLVAGIVAPLKGLTSLDGLQAPLDDIKTKVTALNSTLATALPEVHSVAGDDLATLVGLFDGLLPIGGGLGLLAGIPPSA